MASDPEGADGARAEGRAPVLGTWGAWYALVIATLAAVVVLLTLIGRAYR
jgi:hypothetical protein